MAPSIWHSSADRTGSTVITLSFILIRILPVRGDVENRFLGVVLLNIG
jgi:hypothetical protein